MGVVAFRKSAITVAIVGWQACELMDSFAHFLGIHFILLRFQKNQGIFMFTTAYRALCVAAIVAATQPTYAQSMYTITDIGGFSGEQMSRAFGINNAGEVVGQFDSSSGNTHAFLYSNGAFSDLGTLGGPSSAAFAINNSGVIVGASQSSQSNGGLVQAFAYTPGIGMTNIIPPGYQGAALSVNDSGVVVGSYHSGNLPAMGFAYQNGTFTALPRIVPNVVNANLSTPVPAAVNASGQIAGRLVDASDDRLAQPYLYSGQQYTLIGGVPDHVSSRLSGINEFGDVIGYSDDPVAVRQSFLYANGKMTVLGSLGGKFSGGVGVYGINSQDDVVGTAFGPSGSIGGIGDPENGLDTNLLRSYVFSGTHGVIYKNGQLQDLNNLIDPNSGWELLDARSINDFGQIVGEGMVNNQIHAFILTPVPESSTVAYMSLGLVALLTARRRVFKKPACDGFQ